MHQADSHTVLFACWDEEERGLVGSQAWADAAADRGDEIAGVFTFEMIGYRDDAPDTQALPFGFEQLFPEQTAEIAADGNRGDFIALIGDEGSSDAMDRMSELAGEVGVDVVALAVPDSLLTSSAASDLQRSDHAPFWQHGYSAIQITDTANFRNAAYHCIDGEDVSEILDQDFARGVIAMTTAAAGELAGWAPVP